MIDPLTLVLLIKATIALVSLVLIIALLTYQQIINWFVERSNLKESDQNNLAFTLQNKLKSGHYKTVQGIFNPRTSSMLDSRIIKSEHIDASLAAIHAIEQLAIYS